MGAVFYSLDTEKALFKGGFPVISPVEIDFLSDLVNERTMAIVTSIGIQNTETIQFFLSFDDLVSYFYFGKGIGTISIAGILFSDCEGNIPSMSKKSTDKNSFYGLIGNRRGQEVIVSAGEYSFTGVISSFSTNTMAEPDTMSEFQITLQMIEHTLPLSDKQFQSTCFTGNQLPAQLDTRPEANTALA